MNCRAGTGGPVANHHNLQAGGGTLAGQSTTGVGPADAVRFSNGSAILPSIAASINHPVWLNRY